MTDALFAAEGQVMAATDPWLQYGSFGLLALFFVFMMWKGIPKLFDYHKEVVGKIATDNKEAVIKLTEDNKEATEILATEHRETVKELVCSFEKENEACRTERLAAAISLTVNLEKERQSRHDLANQFQLAIKQITMPAG